MATKVSFDQFYREIYQERWDLLKGSLLVEREKVARPVLADSNHPYVMDGASIIAAQMLPLTGSGQLSVLDLCSAPGGKALILFERLQSITSDFTLTLNEPSNPRRERLRKVFDEYLSESERAQCRFWGRDGRSIGIHQPDSFDAILVDAPCSSESHVLKDERELSCWSSKRPRELAAIQYALLCSALLALKRGGHLLYSTCSINPDENDGVIGKLLKKKGESVSVEKLALPEDSPFEESEHGAIYLPDRSALGPLYLALLKKK